jgi:hypothetical protein
MCNTQFVGRQLNVSIIDLAVERVNVKTVKLCATCHHARNTTLTPDKWRCASPKNIWPNTFDVLTGKPDEQFLSCREARSADDGCDLLGVWHQTTGEYLDSAYPKLDATSAFPSPRRKSWNIEDLT